MSNYQPPINYFSRGVSERRRRDVDRVGDMTAKDTTISGRQLILGAGESTFSVVFPVTFSHRPLPHFDPELDENTSPVAGTFPGLDACVTGWDVINKVDGAFDGYFVGATVSVNLRGDTDQAAWVWWSFRGTGLRNPVQITDHLLEDDL